MLPARGAPAPAGALAGRREPMSASGFARPLPRAAVRGLASSASSWFAPCC